MTTSCPIVLASGQVTRADRLSVELVKPTGTPPVILIKWPPLPSVVEPVKSQATVLRSSRSWPQRKIALAGVERLGSRTNSQKERQRRALPA